jgi:DNA-binding transcriptional LysR family regulator
MELRHLRYFVAVAEEEHFGRAARRRHLSQPPLSRQIQQLAEELGLELFQPSGRGVRLTNAGRAFLDGARATLAEAQLAIRTARRAATGEIGHLAIGFVDNSTYAGIVPEIVARLRARRPQLTIDLQVLTTAGQWEALRERHIDAGYCYYSPDDPGVRSEVIYRDRVVLALPRSHALAKRPAVRARDLVGEPFVWFPRRLSPRYYDQIVGTLEAHGATLNVVQEGATDATRLALVASGLGLTLVVESVGALRPRQIVFRRLADLPLEVEALVCWRAEDERSPLLTLLLETTHEVRDKMRARRPRPK